MVFSNTIAQSQTKSEEYKTLLGNWRRTDGNYTLSVRDVRLDGTVDAGYFNPGKINISEANVSKWEGRLKLFVKLQDDGYPGSTYTLYYYTEKDSLTGFYYQAAIKQTFEVIFIRK
jgi:hypothetical protein